MATGSERAVEHFGSKVTSKELRAGVRKYEEVTKTFGNVIGLEFPPTEEVEQRIRELELEEEAQGIEKLDKPEKPPETEDRKCDEREISRSGSSVRHGKRFGDSEYVSWNINEVMTEIENCIEEMGYLYGFYETPNKDKIVLDVHVDKSGEIENFLKSKFPDHYKNQKFTIIEQECESECLIGFGHKLAKETTAASVGLHPDTLQRPSSYATVTCLAENGNSHYLLTSLHGVTKQTEVHSVTDLRGVYVSNIDETLVHVSDHCSGKQGSLRIDNKPKAVDIAALPLKRDIVRDHITSFHNLRDWYRGSDEDLYGKIVSKDGATTGVTKGRIVVTDYTNVLQSLDGRTTLQYFVIESLNDDNEFAAPGDSGALVWLSNGIPLGIVSRRIPGVQINGQQKPAVLAVRLDHCFSELELSYNIKITSLKMFDRTFCQTPVVVESENLSRLVSPVMIFKKFVALRAKPNALKLVNNALWVCHDKGIDSYDSELKNCASFGPPGDNKNVYGVTGVRMEGQTYIIICGHGLYQCTVQGDVLEQINDEYDKGVYTDVVFTDNKLFAARCEALDDQNPNSCCIRIFEKANQQSPWVVNREKSLYLRGRFGQIITIDVYNYVIRACFFNDCQIYATNYENNPHENYGGPGTDLGRFDGPRLGRGDDSLSILIPDQRNNRIQIMFKPNIADVEKRDLIYEKVNFSGLRFTGPTGAVYLKSTLYATFADQKVLTMFQQSRR